LIREGLTGFRRLLGEEHPNVAYAWVHSAHLHYLEGDYGKAEEEVGRALKIYQQSLPKGHPRFFTTLTVMGLILNKTGRSTEAESKLRDALQIGTRAFPKGHYYIAITEGALGECLTTQKRHADAESLLLRSYAVMKSSLGQQDPRTAEAIGRLVTLYEAWGKPDDAGRYRLAPPQAAAVRPSSAAR
jgi:tetratricopeptide (TPR) repeat protein